MKALTKYNETSDPVKKFESASAMFENASNFITPENHNQVIGAMSAQVGFNLGVPPIDEIMQDASEAGYTTKEQQDQYYHTVAKEKYFVPFQQKREERIAELKASRDLKGKKNLKKWMALGQIQN